MLSLVVQNAGRNTAPHLKELLGPLCLAMQDMYPEARAHAVQLFQVRHEFQSHTESNVHGFWLSIEIACASSVIYVLVLG